MLLSWVLQLPFVIHTAIICVYHFIDFHPPACIVQTDWPHGPLCPAGFSSVRRLEAIVWAGAPPAGRPLFQPKL